MDPTGGRVRPVKWAEQTLQGPPGRNPFVVAEDAAAPGLPARCGAHYGPGVVRPVRSVAGGDDRHTGCFQASPTVEAFDITGVHVLQVVVTTSAEEIGLGHDGHPDFDEKGVEVGRGDGRVLDPVQCVRSDLEESCDREDERFSGNAVHGHRFPSGS